MSVLGTGFIYSGEIKTPSGEIITFQDSNLLPQAAVDHIAGLVRGSGGATPIGSWYMFLFEGNYVPTSSVVASDLPGTVVECTAYSEVARPEWDNLYDGTNLIDNLASKAVFTMTAAKRVYGAGIISNSTKGGNTGLVLSIARFSTAKDLDIGTQFSLGAGLTLIPT